MRRSTCNMQSNNLSHTLDKKILNIILKVIGSLLGLILLEVLIIIVRETISARRALKISETFMAGEAGNLNIDGTTFRDLNKNKHLDIYEDWRKSVDDNQAIIKPLGT